MKDKAQKRQKYKKSVVSLPYHLLESLHIESIKEKTAIMEVNKQRPFKPL